MNKIKLLKIMFISLIGITFNNCSSKQNVPIVIPIKCTIPITECNKYKYSGKSIEEELLKCIKEYKINSEVCL